MLILLSIICHLFNLGDEFKSVENPIKSWQEVSDDKGRCEIIAISKTTFYKSVTS